MAWECRHSEEDFQSTRAVLDEEERIVENPNVVYVRAVEPFCPVIVALSRTLRGEPVRRVVNP